MADAALEPDHVGAGVRDPVIPIPMPGIIAKWGSTSSTSASDSLIPST